MFTPERFTMTDGVRVGDLHTVPKLPKPRLLPPPPSEQKHIILTLLTDEPLCVVGEVYYVSSKAWWHRWKAYVGYNCERSTTCMPGMVDNVELLQQGNPALLRRDVLEGVDYVIFDKTTFSLVYDWYL